MEKTALVAGEHLLVASHNEGKLEEMRALLAPLGVQVVSARDMGLGEPEETEDSFLGNARIKAHAAASATGLPALADDSGLEVEALDGAPGVRTADWAETSFGRDFGLAMKRTHEALLACGAAQPWRARFCCTLVLAWPDGREAAFEGQIEGRLVWPIRGAEGHGYDPMFLADGEELTFAEMSAEQKNAISHRSRALAQLVTSGLFGGGDARTGG
ncbi:MAG: non-canonical purine NTP pyrophosphatase [Rhodobacteraceae bacterium]|nr:MAG: non-canonical purine NTP pyrophosphatase [Paracoccaceae bacterium]